MQITADAPKIKAAAAHGVGRMPGSALGDGKTIMMAGLSGTAKPLPAFPAISLAVLPVPLAVILMGRGPAGFSRPVPPA